MGKLRLKIAMLKPCMNCLNFLMFQWKICFIKTIMFVMISRLLRVIFVINLKNWASKNSSRTRTAIGSKFYRNIELYYKQKELRNCVSQLFYVYESSSFYFDFFLLFPYKSAIIIAFKRPV